MKKLSGAELKREAHDYQDAMKSGKNKWQKKRNPISHQTPKRRKRK